MSTASSKAAAVLGSMKSEKKAAASRRNGKLGGRPKMTELQKTRALAGKIAGNSAQAQERAQSG